MKNLLYIGNKLSKKGKTITTIDTLGKALEKEGFQIRYASTQSNIILRFLDMLFSVFKYRKSTDYILIDTYSTLNFYYAYAVSQLARVLKLKYIPILHGGNLPNRLKNSSKLSSAIFNNAFVNVAPSEYTKSAFEDYGYTNVKVIANAIEIENYKFQQRTLDTIKLLWVRSFSELYNPNLAIDVLSKLNKNGVESSLCMVGPENDGALKKAKEYAKALNVEVTFTGKLSKTKWADLSQNYNVFLNTTNFDNMPVSVIEAMALGLPIISTNVGGMPFLIGHNKDGLLVEPKKVKQFVEAILHLKSNPVDVITLTENARKKVKNYDWNTIKQLWISTLK